MPRRAAAAVLGLIGIFCASPAAGQEPAAEVRGPVPPEQSLRHLVLAEEDLAIELVACEPQVVDPVAIRFDEQGRMWVVEMRDYPLGPQDGSKPASRIKILEDTDGDGRFETAHLFADELLFVTGLQPWKGGAIVTLSGKVAYMKDTNGDFKADVNETWFTGFAEQNSQLRANHPTFSLDNWVYVANGLRGGKVVNHMQRARAQEPGAGGQRSEVSGQKEDNSQSAVRNPQAKEPISISGMDFRFHPLTGEAEAVSGNGQFGLTFDDWGNRFLCSNRNPCVHVVIENRYLARAPKIAIPAVVQDVAAAGENSRLYSLTRAWTTSNLHAGQFTAACGVFMYRGDLLPSLRGNVFTCDPTGNLIHREIVQEKGPTFESRPAYEGKEFLASRDEWFRPVNMQLGPEGGLYVVDMYRAVIEHPDFVPQELKNRPDQRLGDDRGRIYRIVPKQASVASRRGKLPNLAALSAAELVKLLSHENAWQRETAQRLLVERQDATAKENLVRAAEKSEHPRGQLHAMWTLAGLGALTMDPIAAALQSSSGPLRQSALAALESLGGANEEQVNELIANRVLKDPVPALRLRAGLVPGTSKNPQVAEQLAQAAADNSDDPWMRRLLLLTAANFPAASEHLAMNLSPASPSEQALLAEVIEANVASRGVEWGAPLLEGLLPAADGGSLSPRSRCGLLALAASLQKRRSSLSELAKKVKAGEPRLQQASKLAAAIAQDEKHQEPVRIDALRLLAYLPDSQEILAAFALREEEVPAMRQAAIGSLARLDALEAWTALVERLPYESVSMRNVILDGILQRPQRIALLLDAIEAEEIRPAEVERARTDRLLKHGDAKIRERAAKIFGSATPADRQKALADYQRVLTMQADATRGKQIFAKNCATCHKVGEIGVNVAPDISDSRTKTAEQILGDIIQPNRAIDSNYIAWNVLLLDGSSASGVLAAETGTSITLRQPEGKTLVVSRGDIEQLKSSGLSLMPEGLEKNIPHQEMADLISFIKNWRYLDGRTPLASP